MPYGFEHMGIAFTLTQKEGGAVDIEMAPQFIALPLRRSDDASIGKIIVNGKPAVQAASPQTMFAAGGKYYELVDAGVNSYEAMVRIMVEFGCSMADIGEYMYGSEWKEDGWPFI